MSSKTLIAIITTEQHMKTLVKAKHTAPTHFCMARSPEGACPGEQNAEWLNGLGEDEEHEGHHERRDDLGQAGLAEAADRDRRRDRRPRDRGDQREEEHHVQVARGVIGDLHERGGAAQLLALEAERSDLRDLRDGDLGGPEEADQQDEEHDDPEFDDVARHARLTPL